MRISLLLWTALVSATACASPIEIQATFIPTEHVIEGELRMTPAEGATEVWFALLANLGRERNPHLSPLVLDGTYVAGFDSAWTRIARVAWSTPASEEELAFELLPAPPTLQTYSLDDVLLRIDLPEGGGELVVSFRTRFPHIWTGEPGRLGEIYTWRFGWHPLPWTPREGERWPLILPAHDYRVDLTVPEGWDAALPGQVTRSEEADAVQFSVGFQHPVRSVSLFIAPSGTLRRATLPFSGTEVEAVALPGSEDALRALATYVPEILRYYEERYGPYPESRVLLVEHPNEVGVAMAADGVVFMPRWLLRRTHLTAGSILSRFGQYILAHELAHLWWGVGIGVDLDAENWLSEGMAQYLSIRWFEDTYGGDGGNLFRLDGRGLGEEMVDGLIGYFNLRQHLTELPYMRTAFSGFDEAVVKPLAEVRYEQASGVRLYDKGYLVLRAAAHLAGEDVFDRVLKQAHLDARSGLFTVSDLQRLLEDETGEDWDPFFVQWVYGEAWADYAVVGLSRTVDGEEHVTRVHLTRNGTGYLPVTVEVRGPDGETASQIWDAVERSETVEFRTPFRVVQAVVDPDHHALDVDRLNNASPPKFVIALGKNQSPLDAYLVQLDLTSEGFAISYLDRFGWAVYPQEMAVTGWVRYGRDWAVAGWAAVRDTLLGSVSLTRYLWATPTLGTPGTYWEPVGDITLTLGRRPMWTIGVDLGWGEVLARAHSGSLSALWLPSGGWRAEVGQTVLAGLFPHTYLTLTGRLGGSSPDLPPGLRPMLTEFRTLASPVPQEERKAFLSSGIWLPPFRPDYSLGGAALVTEARPRVFLSWARLWSEGPQEDIIPAYLEVGAEVVTRVEILGGLAAFTVVVGAGWPLAPLGEAVLYFGIFGF